MNTDLMATIHTIIADHPDRHRQGSWIDYNTAGLEPTLGELAPYALRDIPDFPNNPHRPICRTTACVAGWAAILGGPGDALVIDYERVLVPGRGPATFSMLGKEILGLSIGQAGWLFSSTRSRTEVLRALEWLPAHQDASYEDLEDALADDDVADEEGDEDGYDDECC